MLSTLREQLALLKRPAVLVFFGDHRPSIPGATSPDGGRHTPYVMIRFNEAGDIVRGDNRRVDLTPAELHHAMLDLVLGEPLASVNPGAANGLAETAPATGVRARVAAARGQTSGAG